MPAGGSRQLGWQPCTRYSGKPGPPLPAPTRTGPIACLCISGHLAGCQAPLRVSGPVSAHGLARQLEERSLLSPARAAWPPCAGKCKYWEKQTCRLPSAIFTPFINPLNSFLLWNLYFLLTLNLGGKD